MSIYLVFTIYLEEFNEAFIITINGTTRIYYRLYIILSTQVLLDWMEG